MENNINEIIKCKKKLYEGIDIEKLKHLDELDLEVVLFKGLVEEAQNFLLKSDIKTIKYFEENLTLQFIGKMIWGERKSNEIIIIGAHSSIDFKISKYLKNQYDDFISQEKGLGYITIRKHEENFYFIEKFEPFRNLEKESFKKILDLRNQYDDNEWKNILLGTLGYDLRDSEGITRDLLLIRLLPYVEKNYNYIELGGKATGKTTMAEKLNTGEKINANISASNFIYNTQKRSHGILFSKDVLYLDEVNFTSINNEIAPALLQAKAGNKIEVRGIYNAKSTGVSFVSQGNIQNAEYQFAFRNLLNDFNKGFNNNAHFDRECFLIAGWLIPSYSKIQLKDDTKGIRIDIFEDYLKVLREKPEYSNLIQDIYINLVGNSSSGRFDQQIRKTISGLLKLIYPNKNFELKENKESIDSIMILSCFGKYLIQECASDLGLVDYKNDYLEFSYAGKGKRKITRDILMDFYVKAKENKYFIENEEELISEEIEFPWKVTKQNLKELTSNIEYSKQRIFIPEDINSILNTISNEKLKSHLKEDCITILAYQESNKSVEDKEKNIDAFTRIVKNVEVIFETFEDDESYIYNYKPLINFLNNYTPKEEDCNYLGMYNSPYGVLRFDDRNNFIYKFKMIKETLKDIEKNKDKKNDEIKTKFKRIITT